MPETPDSAHVRFARRFVAHHPDEGTLHGVQFPSGRILVDHPTTGLVAFLHMDALTEGRDDVTVHWADEEGEEYTPAPADGSEEGGER